MALLITGGSGYIGSRLCKYLINLDEEVIIIIRKTSSLQYLNNLDSSMFFTLANDYSNLNQVFENNEIDAVFHLAAYSSYEHDLHTLPKHIESNIYFSTLLIEMAQKYNVNYFISASTTWQDSNELTHSPFSINLYSATKAAFKEILKFYSHSYGIYSMNLLFTNVYGNDDKRDKLISTLLKSGKDGVFMLTKGEQEFDILHVDEVCEGFYKAFQYLKNRPESYFNEFRLIPHKVYILKDFIEDLSRELGLCLDIRFGEKAYRKNEIMKINIECEKLPAWEPGDFIKKLKESLDY